MIQRPDPIRCTYCDEISMWSAERIDRTMMGETHTCPSCGQTTHTCDDLASHTLDSEQAMAWIAAEPLY